MATANKVHFGLKEVHYAVITYSSAGVPSWGTPVAVPGAVNLTISRNSNDTDFYADNIKYYHIATNNGYTGTLEMADFPVDMRQALWNDTVATTSKMLIEDVDAQPAEFALMFEIDGDQTPERYCFYRCVASRPDVAGATKAESTEVQTQSCDLTVMPVIYSGNAANGRVYYRTTADTPANTYNSFYSSVMTTIS
jgi:phage major tail protein, phi13 family